MDIKLFKLLNGLEIIGEVVRPTGQGWEVKHPLVAQLVDGKDGKPVLGFYEYTMLTGDDTPVYFRDHALQCDPMELLPEIAQAYAQQHSKIILPPSQTGQILHG
jgi:hypothetical protein